MKNTFSNFKDAATELQRRNAAAHLAEVAKIREAQSFCAPFKPAPLSGPKILAR